MFYSQYHRLTQLPDGTTCVLQYDYSMPYGAEVLQRRLPEFQTCVTVVLLLAWLTAGAISTHHFAGLLRRDAALLTGRHRSHRPAAAGRAHHRAGEGAGVRGDAKGHG